MRHRSRRGVTPPRRRDAACRSGRHPDCPPAPAPAASGWSVRRPRPSGSRRHPRPVPAPGCGGARRVGAGQWSRPDCTWSAARRSARRSAVPPCPVRRAAGRERSAPPAARARSGRNRSPDRRPPPTGAGSARHRGRSIAESRPRPGSPAAPEAQPRPKPGSPAVRVQPQNAAGGHRRIHGPGSGASTDACHRPYGRADPGERRGSRPRSDPPRLRNRLDGRGRGRTMWARSGDWRRTMPRAWRGRAGRAGFHHR